MLLVDIIIFYFVIERNYIIGTYLEKIKMNNKINISYNIIFTKSISFIFIFIYV